ncbi:Down syndrome cell adhesion molecule-like protein Dscam2 [Penaeus monodon]|uniref:Down syndrome cell adhesion molecule-like protein Dscam2 n=1 Tax=Penaeus monodon TaxID=6687 RepID=UPI0018A77C70|nr:Down syndrome cell adhesion molecule-like protein Dscam2 [Penaeus monodon]
MARMCKPLRPCGASPAAVCRRDSRHELYVCGVGRSTQGPVFSQEPPRIVHFTNSTGVTVNCVADGTPTPAVTWTMQDGRPVEEVMGLREVLTNGSLVFPPFPANQYDTQLHANTYICRATSAGGTVLARPSQIRAVVVGDYEVQVYDQLVMAGNTAVLRCAVPSYVREYVTVTSWVHDDSFNIYPSLHGGECDIVSLEYADDTLICL